MRKFRNTSLNTKAFLGIFLLLSIISVIVYTILIFNIPTMVASKTNQEMEDTVYKAIQRNLSEDSADDIKANLEPLVKNYHINITVINKTTQSLFLKLEDIPNSMAKDLKKKKYYMAIKSPTFRGIYEINVWYPANEENRIRDILITQIPIIFCIIFGISIGASFFVARIITKPITRLSETSKELASSATNTIPYLDRMDEIGQLSNNLSDMYESLQLSLQKEHHQMELRDKLFQSVSHELKTPITILKGELEGMIYNMGDYKDRDTYLKHSLEVVEEMASLVYRVLMLSKNTTQYTKTETDLSQLVFSQCERYTTLANQKNIDLICDSDESVMAVIDIESFKRVISNLLSNAIKYSPVGATVVVHLEESLLYIENSGVFLPEDSIPDLFEPFVRLEESHNHDYGGSGLGLYLVKSILQAHDMSYEMRNTENGVRFTITF